jgi:hypothetical protein
VGDVQGKPYLSLVRLPSPEGTILLGPPPLEPSVLKVSTSKLREFRCCFMRCNFVLFPSWREIGSCSQFLIGSGSPYLLQFLVALEKRCLKNRNGGTGEERARAVH